jgi:hypothetical protein
MTTADPLTVLLAEFESVASAGDARTRAVRAVSAALAWHNAAPDADAARGERRAAATVMRNLQPAVTGQVIGIDMLLDWDLVVPEAVAAEAASAAGVLARLAHRPALSQGWVAWHARFLDRYGPGALVPVLDAVDDSRGLGFPAGYLGSPYPEQHGPLTGRDKTLLILAQLAAICAGDPVQPSAEMTVRVEVPRVSRTGRSIRSSLKGGRGNDEGKVLHSGIQGTGCEDGGRINPITHSWVGGT